jgi:probable rRNA maturation factor
MQTFSDTDTLSISSTLKKTPAPIVGAGVSLQKIHKAILGKSYELSILYIGDTLSKKLNNIYRKKNRPTNVLSFPLSKTSGELFLNIRKIERELRSFDRNLIKHTIALAIHGMLHLKGLDHGKAMDKEEASYERRFLPLR